MKNLKWYFDTDEGNRWLLFLIYILVVTAFTVFDCFNVYGPTHFDDETEYWLFAQHLISRHFDMIFTPDLKIPPLYPLSIIPAFFMPKNLVYQAVLFLDNLYSFSIIFPIYFLLRKLTENHRLSLGGAVVILFQPLFFVNSQVMLSENLFLPLFTWATLLSFTSLSFTKPQSDLQEPRWIETILLGLLIGFCYLTRFITLSVIPVFLLVWWLRPFNGEKGKLLYSNKKMIHLCIMVAGIVLPVAIWVMIGEHFHLSAGQLLGFQVTPTPTTTQLSLGNVGFWVIAYAAAIIFIAAPVIGPLILSVLDFDHKQWRDDQYRWLIAVVLITGATLAINIYHSVSAPYNYPAPSKMQWRYLMILSILFVITALTALSRHPDYYKNIRRDVFILTVSIIFLFLSSEFVSFHSELNQMTTGEELILNSGLGLEFVFLAAIIQLLIFIPWKRLPSLNPAILSVGFCIIYLIFLPNNYSALESWDVNINYPVKMVVDRMLVEGDSSIYNSHLVIIYNPSIITLQYQRAREAFMVRKFNNVELISGDAASLYYTDESHEYLIVKVSQGDLTGRTYIVYNNIGNIPGITPPRDEFALREFK